MTTPLFSVGGLASGLDTNTIISQLMDAERVPLTRLQQRQNLYQAKVNAWQTIRTRMSALETAADKLKTQSKFADFVKVSSSSPDDVDVAKASGAVAGSISFTVEQLAATHQMSSDTNFTSADATVGAGTFTITVGSTNHQITTTASTTLKELASSITASDAGVSASVISTDGTNYKLLLTAKESGTVNQFTASGTQTGMGSFSIVQQALDSRVKIGSGAGALTVTRSSNTISDLMAGATVTLKKVTSSPVTVTVERDIDATVTAIKEFVDEANRAISTLSDYTKYDATTKKAGLLQGDSTARSLLTDVRGALINTVNQLSGDYTYPGSVGISIDRKGTITLDETKLRTALENDFESVTNLFARSASTTDSRVKFLSVSDATDPGSYAIQITRAAQQASKTGSGYITPILAQNFTISVDGTNVGVTVSAGSNIGAAVGAINAALQNAGVTAVTASNSGGAIALKDSRYGSAHGFVVAGADWFGLNGSFFGQDVAGTINGETAEGTGRTLKVTTPGSPVEGLSLEITALQSEVTAAGGTLNLGSVIYSRGIGGRVSSFVHDADAAKGPIATSSDRWNAQIDLVKRQITDMEVRLELKERGLRQQFAAMESALSKLSTQGNWLAAQLAQGG